MFNASFIITKTADPSTFIITDNSSGSDPDLTGRVIYLYTANGSLLVPAITWPIGQSSYTFTGLEQDVALNVRVEWSSSNPLPDPSTYTYSELNYFVQFGEQFLYGLTQQQTANPSIVQDTTYYANKGIVRTEIDSAINAIDVGNDLAGSEYCIARYTAMMNAQNYLF